MKSQVTYRTIFRMISFVSAMLTSASGFAVDLRYASNRQLLDELEERLTQNPPPVEMPSASVSYSCGNQQLLSAVTVNSSGTAQSFQLAPSDVSIPSFISPGTQTRLAACPALKSALVLYRSKITSTKLIGVCAFYSRIGFSGYFYVLRTYAVSPAGLITNVSDQDFRADGTACESEALSLSSSN